MRGSSVFLCVSFLVLCIAWIGSYLWLRTSNFTYDLAPEVFRTRKHLRLLPRKPLRSVALGEIGLASAVPVFQTIYAPLIRLDSAMSGEDVVFSK